MSSTSTNRAYLLQTSGENPGTWGLDPGLNGNFQKIDSNLGGVATIALSSSNVTLSASEYANGTILLSGTLTSNVNVIFPPVNGWWTIINNTTGSFVANIVPVGGTQSIVVEQGAIADVMLVGTTARFRNLPPVGTYLDLIDATVPLWISSCTVPPYLLCDGSTFSAVTYPYLNTKLGGTTLPDLRGRSRFYLNGGSGRITTAGSGIDGDTRLSAGGAQNVALTEANLAAHTHGAATGATTPAPITANARLIANPAGGSAAYITDALNGPSTTTTWVNAQTAHTHTIASAGSGTAHNNMTPACISGITMIRAA